MRTFAWKSKTTPGPATPRRRSAAPTIPLRSDSGSRRRVSAILRSGPQTISPAPLGIQRTIRGRVVSQRESDPRDAAACMVHLHPNEQNALEVAKDLRVTHCANLVFLEDTSGRSRPDREIQVEVTVGGSPEVCEMDSNRIFSEAGRNPESGGAFSGCSDDAKAAAESEVESFVRTDLGTAISQCRGGSGSADLAGPLPVVAFHNNSNTAERTAAALRTSSLNIRWYESGGRAEESAEQDPAVLGARTNPAVLAREDPDNFLLVTRPEDFDAFRGQRNVVLQAGSPTDDGSLSVVLASDRYINIEAQGKAYRGHGSSRFATNRAMALEVFEHLQVPERPCIGGREADIEAEGRAERESRIRESAQRAQEVVEIARRWALRWRGSEFEHVAEHEAEYDRRAAMERHWREVQEIRAPMEARLAELRASVAGSTLPCPSPAPSPARVFCSTRELDNRKALWARRIGEMDPQTVVEWIVGQTDCRNFASTLRRLRRSGGFLSSAQHDRVVLCEAFEESQQQIDALRAALPDAAARGTRDPLRTFSDQQTIWEEKYRFLPSRGTFGAIRLESQDACVAALGGGDPTREAALRTALPVGGEWDTGNTDHQDCWLNVLTPEQRQREILQTSSAPGISRHHFGTDVDLGTGRDALTNPPWSPGGRFEDAYEWLQQNALAYGMLQSFTAGRSGGYLEERWHWSYFPVAQALVDFAAGHPGAVETRLGVLWDQRLQAMISAGHIPQAAPGAPQEDPYSHVRSNWRDFVFQVLQEARSP